MTTSTTLGKFDLGLVPVAYDGPKDPADFHLTGMGEVPDPDIGGAVQDALNRPKASLALTDYNISTPSAWQWPFPFEWYPWGKDKEEEAPIDEPIPIPPTPVDPAVESNQFLMIGACMVGLYFLVRRFG